MIWNRKSADEHSKYDKVFIYKSELEYLSKSILDYPNIETGGNLFGYWTHSGRPVIQYVIGPGKNANHERSFFNQDNEFLVQIGTKLMNEHALQHIGEWHSHHKLGLARPSGHDSSTIIKGMKGVRMNKFLLLIGNCDDTTSTINPFLYIDGRSSYVTPEWVVLEGNSPIRSCFDSKYINMNYVPKTQTPSLSNVNIVAMDSMQPIPTSSDTLAMPKWMEKKESHTELKAIMDFFGNEFSTVELQIREKQICINLRENNKELQIILPPEFPDVAPRVYVVEQNQKRLISEDSQWKQSFDYGFAEDFISFYLSTNN